MLELAQWWSQWSTCKWMKTGAVVCDQDYQVLVSGYNGPARGLPHCFDVDQPREDHRDTCLHAELNCILQAARIGVSLRGGWMFSLHRPCIRCSPHLVQVGITRLCYSEDYETDGRAAEALGTLVQSGIEVHRIRLDTTFAV
jgi:dCMP deaminase